MSKKLFQLQKKITGCKKCPRLVKYISGIRSEFPDYWCKPVPSFGDYNAGILILGLAPGRFGSNRTGRMFTGDSSGKFLYSTLHEVALCNKPNAVGLNDGLVLKNCYITAVGRCAPPQNKPTPNELENCFPYFAEEVNLLKDLKVIVALGKIAFDGYLKWLFNYGLQNKEHHVGATFTVAQKNRAGARPAPTKKEFKFSHGAIYKSKDLPHVLIASYHPSRQNTQTGKLTRKMFKQVFLDAIRCSSLRGTK